MKKKIILAIMLALLALCASVCIFVFAGSWGDDNYTTDGVLRYNGLELKEVYNKNFQVVSYSIAGFDTETDSTVSIPSTYNGKPVTKIGAYAFQNSSLSEITIPNSITSIESGAFEGCRSLTNIEIPNSVTSIGSRVFSNCSGLTSIVIPNSITDISDYAFSGCRSLININIPNSVTRIGSQSFSNCSSLTSIEIPNTVTTVYWGAFNGCNNLECAIIPTSVIHALPKETIRTVIITDGTEIKKEAFSGFINLRTIEFSDSITSIKEKAFSDCISLTNVVIPNNVNEIEYGAFKGCFGLTSITLPFVGESATKGGLFGRIFGYGEIKQYYSSNDYSMYGIPASLENVIVTGGILTYGAFSNCQNITHIELPNSLTSIEDKVFYNCEKLATIKLPNNVAEIGEFSFSYCDCLTEIVMPNSVEKIGYRAFYDCANLAGIILPMNLIEIDESAFDRCNALANIDIDDSNQNYSCQDGILYNKEKTNIIHVPRAVQGSLEIPNTIVTIDDYTFSSCTGLADIKIPNSTINIGQYAFQDCTGLTSIEIPSSVDTIDNSAFSGCSGLTSISVNSNNCSFSSIDGILYDKEQTQIIYVPLAVSGTVELPNTINKINNYAFSDRSKIITVNLPNSVTDIGAGAFSNCESMTRIQIPNSVKNVGSRAFNGCKSLQYNELDNASYLGNEINAYMLLVSIKNKDVTEYAVNEDTTIIGDYAFENCTKLIDITIPSTVISAGRNSFESCVNITTAVAPASVVYYIPKSNLQTMIINGGTSFVYQSFENCKKLTTISIPDSIKCVMSFAGCESIKHATVPGTALKYLPKSKLETIEIIGTVGDGIYSKAFYNCTNLLNVTINTDITYIGDNAFAYCSSLAEIIIPNSLKSIGDKAFYNCSSLTTLEMPDSVTSIGENAFSGCNELSNLTVSKNVISIGKYAFDKCDNIKSITLPTVAIPYIEKTKLQAVAINSGEVGQGTFSYCENLKNVFIGTDVSYLASGNNGAFAGCSKIEVLVVEIGNKKYHSYVNCIIETQSKTLLLGCKNSAIPSDGSVTKIGDYSFSVCAWDIEHISIPDGVLNIGQYAFAGCHLKTVAIGKDVYNIGEGAFLGCAELTDIVLPNGLSNIGSAAFRDCSKLINVEMPNLLNSIGNEAFENCKNLRKIWLSNTVTSIGYCAFRYCNSLTIYCESSGPRSGWSVAWNDLRYEGSSPNYRTIYVPTEWNRTKPA